MTEIEKKMGYKFKNQEILKLTLTHKSATHSSENSYERLEFLGDAVLELVVSKYLFEHFPHLSEGELTNLRAAIVCSETLSKVAEKLNLKKYIIFGRHEKEEGFENNRSIWSDVLEAIFGGIFLESGFETIEKIVIKLLEPFIKKAAEGKLFYDYKTKLQEIIQKGKNEKIRYIDYENHESNLLKFKSELYIGQDKISEGFGSSKKEAQQDAAFKALKKMGVIED
ncbi:ribonuclease III [Caldicellulosiruptor morganii]|uniref:Ribonuclease 3 n=1 Tax=Caldicellulosiruptor morganii TaxID=1387555 RepID=A0ABY7BJU2_9FIRM|nr:ribonuclease III [Caldicellulosiruptor morganii]WAM33083.1 ribonuclease III [Caldicellulosiruptor morganii]